MAQIAATVDQINYEARFSLLPDHPEHFRELDGRELPSQLVNFRTIGLISASRLNLSRPLSSPTMANEPHAEMHYGSH